MKKDDFKTKVLFPVVGIGASAGGLEQFTEFFKAMPPDSGAAFIVVQHLDPNHKSILDEIIRQHTEMPVRLATDGAELLPDTVFILPPKMHILLKGNRINLIQQSEKRVVNMTVDRLFNSLAVEAGPLAVGIILSGSGFDGTDGLKSIKENGGLIIAQDPDSAEYPSMPKHAVKTGVVDFICSTEEMPALLGKILQNIQQNDSSLFNLESEAAERDVKAVMNLLYEKTGNDFSKYKKSTVFRRISRRMVINRTDTIGDYLGLLREDASEIDRLFTELLIGVTSFFRDSGAFSVLQERVIKKLVSRQKEDSCLRVWVPGCSTGEEAYTLAIIVKELMKNSRMKGDIKIFATDINEQAVAKAREGLFEGTVKDNLPQDIFNSYFHYRTELKQFQINSDIRDMIVFAVQNVLVDPPFSQMDLISCRNLLIYLNPEQQDKLFQIFHYALKDDGILFLGESETVGKQNGYFSAIDRKYKIYKKLFSVTKGSMITRMATSESYGRHSNRIPAFAGVKAADNDYKNLVETIILDDIAPCTVLINERHEILYIHGRSGLYLEPAEGNMNININRMARDGLRIPLSNLLRKVKTKKAEASARGILLKEKDEILYIDITVKPVNNIVDAQSGYIAAFSLRERKDSDEASSVPDGRTDDKDAVIQELEIELSAMREYLQTTIEEKESSNEELQSTNEELQSSNEELQSTNEELETSKEELQSINEELTTVNSELEHKVEQLTEANNDIDNLLKSTEVATIFLDTELNIKRFTPSVADIIDLINGDIGRPLNRIVTNLEYTDLAADTQNVLQTSDNIEKEVSTRDGRLFLMRIMPYYTLENIIEGVVLTFTDVTRLRITEQKVRQLAKFPDQNPFPVMRISRGGRILYANTSSAPLLSELRSEEGGLLPEDWITNMAEVLDSNRLSQIELPVGDNVYILAVAPIAEEGYLNIYGTDITERKIAERELKSQKDHLKLALNSANAGAWRLDLKTMEYDIDDNFCSILGFDQVEMRFKFSNDRIHPDDLEAFSNAVERLSSGESDSFSSEHRLRTADGNWLWVHEWGKKDAGSQTDGASLYGVAIDISEQKMLEQSLIDSVEEKSMLLRELSHRTKNNMFVIRSMISLHAANTDNEEFREIAKDIDGKIYSMALVHQKLYKSRNFSQIELKSFFEEFLDVLFQSYRSPDKQIELNFNASPATVHIDRAIPCGIAVAEIISNIFKHAFKDRSSGGINFDLSSSEDAILLVISDNGRGVPEGFDFRAQSSLGLKTVFMIIEQQIQGKVEFLNGDGVTCRIEFQDIKTDGDL